MKPKDDIEQFARGASISTDAARDKQVLSQMHEAYAHAAQPSVSAPRLGYWEFIFENRFARLAAAAVILLAWTASRSISSARRRTASTRTS